MRHAIVGNGVAGVTAAQAIKRDDPAAEVHLFGAEPHPYYRRPLLWEFIAGQIGRDALYYRPAEWYAARGITLHLATEITGLDTAAHRFVTADGAVRGYDRLLLAAGARAFIPVCAGSDNEGVFSLRTLDDALRIRAYTQLVSSAVVVGGGLLGLETARALRTAGLEVTVVETFPYLLPRQLDIEGATVMQALLEEQGLHVITGARTEAILGKGRAEGMQLQDGLRVSGELVVFSTGIRSEVALAQAAGLAVKRGVVVDEHLLTSAPDVYAAGDVAEFQGQVYGIIPPAIEQARIAAANMVAPGSATYTGSLPSTTLKVAGAELTSLGQCVAQGEEYTALRHVDLPSRQYRKYVLRGGRIVGAILLNDSARLKSIAQLIERGRDVSVYADQLLNDGFDLRSLLS